MPERIYLSSPETGELERRLVREAFESNWIAPLGPHVDAFERELASEVGARSACAVSSGTAGLHLALQLAGVGAGDEVLCSTFTFVASANPILYLGARPVFIDSDEESWNLDPNILAETLRAKAAAGRLPKALMLAHIYGQSANLDPILDVCRHYGVVVLEDAAESLGATYKGKAVGAHGRLGVYSFNGNKVITTSGGGMIVSDDANLIERARFLATQARDAGSYYRHSHVGYNYRLSNVCAAIGRGQLKSLGARVAARRAIFERYRQALAGVPGLVWMPEASFGRSTRWLSCFTLNPGAWPRGRDALVEHMERRNIETRPVWLPLHLQPLFAGSEYHGGKVAERIGQAGVCLPSSSHLKPDQQQRVIDGLLEFFGQPALAGGSRAARA